MRRPLRDKTAAELYFIIKDAGESVAAVKGSDYQAECKYLDQVNDAMTEVAARRRGE